MAKYRSIEMLEEALKNVELALDEYYNGDREWAERWLLKAARANRPRAVKPLTFARLHQVLDYDPTSGHFTWKFRPDADESWNIRCAGKRAGTRIGLRGYYVIMVDGGRHYAHKLAWLYVHGKWPANQIDHINSVSDDNRIVNLRPATPSQNASNATKKVGKSGIRGVRITRSGKWYARISHNGKSHYLGIFASKDEARSAYAQAAKKYHGEFARLQ
jgi:hypothetical protein